MRRVRLPHPGARRQSANRLRNPPRNASGSALRTPLRRAGPRPSGGTRCPPRRPATAGLPGEHSTPVPGRVPDARRLAARSPPAPSGAGGVHTFVDALPHPAPCRCGPLRSRAGRRDWTAGSAGTRGGTDGASSAWTSDLRHPRPLPPRVPPRPALGPHQRPSRVSRSGRKYSSSTSSPKTMGTGYSGDCTARVRYAVYRSVLSQTATRESCPENPGLSPRTSGQRCAGPPSRGGTGPLKSFSWRSGLRTRPAASVRTRCETPDRASVSRLSTWVRFGPPVAYIAASGVPGLKMTRWVTSYADIDHFICDVWVCFHPNIV